jgi:hypothetical protein
METIEPVVINEVWRSVDGYINYQVSNIGRVRNCTTGRMLKPFLNKQGYHTINLNQYGDFKHWRVHQLVAQEFLTKPDSTHTLSVDHIDRNKTNNQVSNLRYATVSQNNANRCKRANTSSSYLGVSWSKKNNKWQTCISLNRKNIHIGYFENEHDAARAYNDKALELHGEFANLNEIEDE